MCTICAGSICSGGLCQPTTINLLVQYAHYLIFVALGIFAAMWTKIKVSFHNIMKSFK